MRRALACAALLLGPAAAADSDGPDVLPPWVVAESRLRPDAGAVRASAWLAADAWSGRGIATLADAFRHLPGALMLESFGGFEPPRLTVRGSGVQSAPSSRGLALRLDDLPLGLADGSFNAALFDPLLGTALEVQRGLDGWRAAPATLGGAIDLRTVGGVAAKGESVRVDAGSFGGRRLRGATTQRLGDTRTAAAFGFAAQDGYREHSGQERASALATLERSLGPVWHGGFTVYHVRARYDVPGPLTLAEASSSPRAISDEVRRDRPRRESSITRLSASATYRMPATELEVAIGGAHTDDDFRQLQANGVTLSRSDDASVHLIAARRFSTGEILHQLRLVADASRGWRRLSRFTNEEGRRGAEFARDRLSPVTATLQIEDAFAVTSRLTGTVGVARVEARRDATPERGRDLALRWRGGRTLPQAGLRWRLAPGTTLFTSVSSAVEPPTYDDLLVVAGRHPEFQRKLNVLSAQRATTAEAGIRRDFGTLAWDATLYDASWHGEILRLSDARGAALGAVNANRTRHRGIEAAARWRLVDGQLRLTLIASATWGDFRFEEDPIHGNGRLAGLPPHAGYADLVAELTDGYFGAAGADWTHGRTLVDHAGQLGYGGRSLAHIRIGRRHGHWTGFVEVRDVFDRGGIASTAGVLDRARNPSATSIFLPATGRSFNLGLEWRR